MDEGFGDFEIEARLAPGDRFERFLARRDDERVEIEWLFDSASADAVVVQVFGEDTAIQRAIDDPRVIAIAGAGSRLVRPWRAHARPPGATLAAALARGSAQGGEVPAGVVVSLAREIGLGLHALHTQTRGDQELSHVLRRLTPANLLVGYDGIVRICRTGILGANRATRLGFMYASPEQVSGERLDPRSDLFALGSILFEVVTGVSPFARETMFGTGAAVVREPAPVLSGAIGEVIARCLAKDTEARFASADAVVRALPEGAADLGGWAKALVGETPWLVEDALRG